MAKTISRIESLPRIASGKEVGVYCRVSSKTMDQLESLAAQVSEMVRLVRRSGVDRLYDVYIDVMSGAHEENRPGFQRMLNDRRNRKVGVILCKSISRFGRNAEEMIRTIREIREYGVNVFFVVENINSLESESEHIITIIEAFREEENRVRSENIRMGLKAGALSGKSGLYSRRCYGYRKGDDGELQIVPEEANVVRTIYSIYLEGASINKIAAYLKEKGIKSPTGKENWCCRTIDEMLSNEKTMGM